MNDFEPLKVAYSREELMRELTKWMVDLFGDPMLMDPSERDSWYRDNGLIAHFIRDFFPNEKRK